MWNVVVLGFVLVGGVVLVGAYVSTMAELCMDSQYRWGLMEGFYRHDEWERNRAANNSTLPDFSQARKGHESFPDCFAYYFRPSSPNSTAVVF